MFQIIENIKEYILNPIASLIVAVSFFYFIWGVYDFVAGQDNANQVERGKKHFIYGLFGMFLTVGAFGVINFIGTSIGAF